MPKFLVSAKIDNPELTKIYDAVSAGAAIDLVIADMMDQLLAGSLSIDVIDIPDDEEETDA